MLAVLVSLLLLLEWSRQARPSRQVATGQGAVRGYRTPASSHYAYLGLPYATQSHRFKAPKPPRRWDGIFEASHRIKCPQPDGSGIEDCLVVNVFAPEFATAAPVLVFMHDGNFQNGWGPHRPPTRLLSQGIVVVTFNYRVGALGFLCLGIPGAPGNAGLTDQVSALYWVHRNIASFGGDPKDVTVYGVGAGAASIQLLIMSGATEGLFHKAILESGSALSPLSLSYDPLAIATDAAVSLGYKGETRQELLYFYKNLPTATIVNISNLFLPCVENKLATRHSILERDPYEILKSRDYHTVPILIAYSDAAGAKLEDELRNITFDPEAFIHVLPSNLHFDSETIKKRVSMTVKDFYLDGITTAENIYKDYAMYFNDVIYEYPIIKSAQLIAATNKFPVYLMKFSIEKLYGNSVPMNRSKNINEYLFDSELIEDHLVSSRLLTLWSNFIKMR
ncbi:hypothetical protein ACJJTC_005274 [Scirpophaga incertulas]